MKDEIKDILIFICIFTITFIFLFVGPCMKKNKETTIDCLENHGIMYVDTTNNITVSLLVDSGTLCEYFLIYNGNTQEARLIPRYEYSDNSDKKSKEYY